MKKTFIFTCLCILFSFFACKNTADVDKPVLLDCLKTPLADFDLPNNATVYANTSGYLFSNTSVNFETVKWDFGDKTPISTAVNPEHIFTALGDYNVSLTVINCKNDSVKVSKKITVKNSIEFEKIVPNSQNAYFSTLLSINEDKFIIQGIGWSGYGLQLSTFAFGVKSIYTKIWESSVSTFKFNDDKSGTFRKDIVGDNLYTFC